jgi:hypothetical protein
MDVKLSTPQSLIGKIVEYGNIRGLAVKACDSNPETYVIIRTDMGRRYNVKAESCAIC